MVLAFFNISGKFYCSDNNLTSLKGCPNSIGGDFSCSYNNLTSLKGSPSYIGGDFHCSNNNLTKFAKVIVNKCKCDFSGNKFEEEPSDKELIKFLLSKKWSFVLLEKNYLSKNL